MRLWGQRTKQHVESDPAPQQETTPTPPAPQAPSVSREPRRHKPAKEPRDWAAIQGRVAYAFLAAVTAAISAMSYTGLIEFATTILKLPLWLAWVVPVSLDGAALACAFMALRSMLRHDATFGARMMLWAFTLASGGFNYYSASASSQPAALFFGGMSIASVLMFDLVLRQIRRDVLRQQGAVEDPLPRFRLMRWLVAFGETFQAIRWATTEGVTAPADAVRIAREYQAWKDELRGRERPRFVPSTPTPPLPPLSAPLPEEIETIALTVVPTGGAAPGSGVAGARRQALEPAHAQAADAGESEADVDLSEMSKAAAVRHAVSVVQSSTEGDSDAVVPLALDWLAERGKTVDRSYAYDVVRGRSGRRQRRANLTPVTDDSDDTTDARSA